MELIWALSGTDSALTSQLVWRSRCSAAEERPKTWWKSAATGRTPGSEARGASVVKTRRERKTEGKTPSVLNAFQVVSCHPKAPGFTARNGTASRM